MKTIEFYVRGTMFVPDDFEVLDEGVLFIPKNRIHAYPSVIITDENNSIIDFKSNGIVIDDYTAMEFSE